LEDFPEQQSAATGRKSGSSPHSSRRTPRCCVFDAPVPRSPEGQPVGNTAGDRGNGSTLRPKPATGRTGRSSALGSYGRSALVGCAGPPPSMSITSWPLAMGVPMTARTFALFAVNATSVTPPHKIEQDASDVVENHTEATRRHHAVPRTIEFAPGVRPSSVRTPLRGPDSHPSERSSLLSKESH
jgi:hypothetical protein